MLEFLTMIVVMSAAFLGASITVALIIGGVIKAARALRGTEAREAV